MKRNILKSMLPIVFEIKIITTLEFLYFFKAADPTANKS